MNKRRRFIAKRRRAWKKSVKPFMAERLIRVGDRVVPVRGLIAARNEKEALRLANPLFDEVHPDLDWVDDAVILYCTFW